MKTVEIELTGTSPYLMHRFSDESSLEKKTRRIQVDNETPRELATKVAYIDTDGSYYFSAASIPGTMSAAGASHKMKSSRKTLKFVVPSAVRTESDKIFILGEDGKPAANFEVDSRPVMIPATRGRVMRHRPRFDAWKARFRLIINDDLLAPAMAHQLLNEAGVSVGVGDFRPAKGGPFGTFLVSKFAEV
jgi:hypothetical protein